ncbi:hypothetical protein [Leptolyngbya sp. FACHB-261]|uniref:hypothetical protein n=1 Tax=Leptolyngbya sp. FACHB-261 TaxID=2692806 RepID=UPI001681FE75|nr:hypothetical protein [Leptolyngbya sp. FACHB-261]MBD2101353.1 hypothetical protein [Leptolyngbya sp. FACHB-261]
MGVRSVGSRKSGYWSLKFSALTSMAWLLSVSAQPVQAQTVPEPSTEFRSSLPDALEQVSEGAVRRFELRFPDQVAEQQIGAISTIIRDAYTQQTQETPYLRSLDLPNPYTTSLQESSSYYRATTEPPETETSTSPAVAPTPVFQPAPAPSRPVRSLW